MKKVIISVFMLIILLVSTASTVFADSEVYIDDIPNDSHKIKNKWDLTGSYTAFRPVEGVMWDYEIHIKQAMYGPYSQGVITFTSGDKVITAHVEDVKEDLPFWTKHNDPLFMDNLAAVGWADYNGAVYNFMFLYATGGIWIILSTESYETVWAAGNVWTTNRAYQVLLCDEWWPQSEYFEFDPKMIHFE